MLLDARVGYSSVRWQTQVTGCIIVFTFVIGNQKLEHDQVKNKGQVDRAHKSIIDTKCAHRKVNALT